jgi:hypothetical protein
MSDHRENYFILLDIDPYAPWSDDEFKKILQKNQTKWSNERNPKKRKIYTGYLEQIAQIQEIMGNPNLRTQEAENARIEQAAQEDETKDKILNSIYLLNAGKRYITEKEIKNFLKKFGNYNYVDEAYIKNLLVEKNISIQNQNDQEEEQEILELSPKIIERIDQNLMIVSKDNLYDFLGAKTTENCDQLKTIAKNKYNQLQGQGTTDNVFTASKELASEAQQILGNENERLKYDNYLQEKPYKFLEEDINVIAQSDQENILYPAQYTELLNKAKLNKLDIIAAKKYLKKYARKNSLTIIEPSEEEVKTKPSSEPKKSCADCGTLNSLTEEFCINCGASFKVRADDDLTLTPEAQKILEEFESYQSPGDQIEFFNNLALSYPINIFCELLKKIKQETILVLSIQTIKKIALEQQSQLQTNQQLLLLLSKQAQLGETDLIRWAAATTIEEIGFSPAQVYQYLAEKPRDIADKIIQHKSQEFNHLHLRNSNDYYKFVQFWTYGAFDELRERTINLFAPSDLESLLSILIEREKQVNDSRILLKNLVWVSIDVINSLGIQGLNNIGFSVQKANQMGENALLKDENELFEFFVLTKLGLIPIKSDFLDQAQKKLFLYSIDVNPNNISFCQNFLIQCLQSNSPYNRFLAARAIYDGDERFGLGKGFYQELQEKNSLMANAVYIFYHQPNLDTLNLVYSDLLSMAKTLVQLYLQLSRKQVKEDCQILRQKFLAEIQQREQLFNEAKQKSLAKKASIESAFKDLQETEEFSKISDFKILDLPDLSLENHDREYKTIFHEYNIRLDNIDKKILAFQQALSTRNNIKITLNECKSLDSEIYNQYFVNLKLPKIPNFNPDLDRDEYFIDNFRIYEQKLAFYIKKIFNEFISESKSELDLLKTNLDSSDEEVKKMSMLIDKGIMIDETSSLSMIFLFSFPVLLFYIYLYLDDPTGFISLGFVGFIVIFLGGVTVELIIIGFLVQVEGYVGDALHLILFTPIIIIKFIYSFVSKALFTSKWKGQKQQSIKQYQKYKLKIENINLFQQKLEKLLF